MRKQLATLASTAALAAALTLFGCKEEKAEKYSGIYEYEYPYSSEENQYIVLKEENGKLKGLYYGTSDEFDEAREGYMCGFFVAPMNELEISGDTIRFVLSVKNSVDSNGKFSSDLMTKPVDLKIASTQEALEKGYENWIQQGISYEPRKYAGIISASEGTIFFKEDNRTFAKQKSNGAKEASKTDAAVPAQAEQEAKTEETAEGEGQSPEAEMIDFDKLKEKDGIYYLNNVPFTGLAGYQRDVHESWEFKDGKKHGEYEYYNDGCETVGNYQNGKRHGKWVGSCGDGEENISFYKNDVLVDENGKPVGNAEETPEAETGAGVYAGQAIKEFVAIFEKQYTVKKEFEEEGEDSDAYDVYRVYENKELLFEVRLDETNVSGVVVLSPKIKTDRGIGVGATIKDVQAKYDYDGRTCDEGYACEVKDFSGSLWFWDRDDGSKYLHSIGLPNSFMLTADLRIIKKPEASK